MGAGAWQSAGVAPDSSGHTAAPVNDGSMGRVTLKAHGSSQQPTDVGAQTHPVGQGMEAQRGEYTAQGHTATQGWSWT